MDGGPTVIVRKSGFLASIARGVFMLLTVIVASAAVLGVFALRLVDHKVDRVLSLGGNVISQVEHWQEVLPPALSDALCDRRAVDYRESVDVSAELRDGRHHGEPSRAVFRVTNRGDEAVSLLALNVVLEDDDGVPVRDFRTYAATPLAVSGNSDDWRGPLLPGSTRTFTVLIRPDGDVKRIVPEIVDVRVFTDGAAIRANHQESAIVVRGE